MNPSFRQILVHLDPTASSSARLAVARRIAQQQDARLAALYAVTPSFASLPAAPELGPAVIETLAELDQERVAAVREAFDSVLTRPGPAVTWAQTDDLPTGEAFAQQALYADLLVLGQHDAGDPAARSLPPDFVETVLIACGRPAVVMPSIGWTRPLGDTVAIAWKQTPEAGRAVQAALPFLRRAARVHVLAWGEQEMPRVGGQALDLDGYLRLHGVAATFHREPQEPDALGEMLLSRVFDLGADLLVMGCYGHARAREWILGGVSRTLLSSMTLPVLMSH